MMNNHCCYVLKCQNRNKTYIGYTVNFSRRLRQHNGEIVGGAKKTSGFKWDPVCIIEGFDDSHMALRFEYRLQRPKRAKKGCNCVDFVIENLSWLIDCGDGSEKKNNKTMWPHLTIYWYDWRYQMHHESVTNKYVI